MYMEPWINKETEQADQFRRCKKVGNNSTMERLYTEMPHVTKLDNHINYENLFNFAFASDYILL